MKYIKAIKHLLEGIIHDNAVSIDSAAKDLAAYAYEIPLEKEEVDIAKEALTALQKHFSNERTSR